MGFTLCTCKVEFLLKFESSIPSARKMAGLDLFRSELFVSPRHPESGVHFSQI